MDWKSFEEWLGKLGEADRAYLQNHSVWKKEYQQSLKNHSLPKGFLERTMEILEGGSESET